MKAWFSGFSIDRSSPSLILNPFFQNVSLITTSSPSPPVVVLLLLLVLLVVVVFPIFSLGILSDPNLYPPVAAAEDAGFPPPPPTGAFTFFACPNIFATTSPLLLFFF
eukprot:c17180_g2_i1.p2 GENE.c17180_g2_i1~~c17180_g2_i1.p2  ORF type:complete len:108 (+),score=7.59 c17180_g2_i1:253-576(+)